MSSSASPKHRHAVPCLLVAMHSIQSVSPGSRLVSVVWISSEYSGCLSGMMNWSPCFSCPDCIILNQPAGASYTRPFPSTETVFGLSSSYLKRIGSVIAAIVVSVVLWVVKFSVSVVVGIEWVICLL